MKIERKWAMPNKCTFLIPPIASLLKDEIGEGDWVDPFCGFYSPAEWKNDLNPDVAACCDASNTDALIFLKIFDREVFDGGLFDPPYSLRQASECYNNYGLHNLTKNVTTMKYWSNCKDEIARIIKPGGKVISFGWNSMGLGKNRGFEISRILLVPHGGSRNDTICTVEKKRKRND